MRQMETWLAGLLWVAVALLLPMAALEPVSLARAATTPAPVLGTCGEGGVDLVMGCSSMSL
jgi:hypothetical protein